MLHLRVEAMRSEEGEEKHTERISTCEALRLLGLASSQRSS